MLVKLFEVDAEGQPPQINKSLATPELELTRKDANGTQLPSSNMVVKEVTQPALNANSNTKTLGCSTNVAPSL